MHLKLLATQLFIQQFACANNKGHIKSLHHLSFVKSTQWSAVDSPHKGPVLQKALPCHDVITVYPIPYPTQIMLMVFRILLPSDYFSSGLLIADPCQLPGGKMWDQDKEWR